LWAFPGGHCEAGEDAAACARRETYEETKYRVGALGEPFTTRIEGDVHYTTFKFRCDAEFAPQLNDEHVSWGWFSPQEALAASLN
jgi:8-oxo-dGTP pyrophosphatase MutT (NUDIX family)